MTIRCIRCNGTGEYLGMGFCTISCELCLDKEVSTEVVAPRPIDKKSKIYQKAIKDIMALDSSLSRPQAESMFEKSYKNL